MLCDDREGGMEGRREGDFRGGGYMYRSIHIADSQQKLTTL